MDIVVDLASWTRAGLGGAMIGIAAALLFALNGRIAGVSGVFGSWCWSVLRARRRGAARSCWA